jgi:hypothetical protein
MGKTLMPLMAGVIVDFHAIFIENGLTPPAVFEAMQMDLYTGIKKGTNFMEQVENSPIIYRVRHVQAHDM